jgi:hypothetical protein
LSPESAGPDRPARELALARRGRAWASPAQHGRGPRVLNARVGSGRFLADEPDPLTSSSTITTYAISSRSRYGRVRPPPSGARSPARRPPRGFSRSENPMARSKRSFDVATGEFSWVESGCSAGRRRRSETGNSARCVLNDAARVGDVENWSFGRVPGGFCFVGFSVVRCRRRHGGGGLRRASRPAGEGLRGSTALLELLGEVEVVVYGGRGVVAVS